MADMMMTRVGTPVSGDYQTIRWVYPSGVNDAYVSLGAGNFQVQVSWSGTARILLAHQPEGASTVTAAELPKVDTTGPRTMLANLASENTANRFFLQMSGATADDLKRRVSVMVTNLEQLANLSTIELK